MVYGLIGGAVGYLGGLWADRESSQHVITGLVPMTLIGKGPHASDRAPRRNVDPVLGWIASNAGLLVDGRKSLATATGIGKEVGSLVDNLNGSGVLGLAMALLRAVIKPAIVGVWAIGALALIVAPRDFCKRERKAVARRFR